MKKKMKNANVAMRARTVPPWTYVTTLLGICAVLVFVGTPAGGEQSNRSDSCVNNLDCAAGQFCNKPGGDCAGEGVCTPVPNPGEIACLDVWDPVCGCDGNTYSNDCYAFLAGVNVAGPGECNGNGNGEPSVPCFLDGQCGDGQFCNKPDGACDGIGQCAPIPGDDFACPLILDPVCGCDGKTYDNDCFAWLAGVNVAGSGACNGNGEPSLCLNDGECGAGQFCNKPDGACDGMGQCAPIPGDDVACPDVWDPVCGCDGRTYSNDCFAFLAGVNVAGSGECNGDPSLLCFLDEQCGAGRFCNKPDGACDGIGQCEDVPGDDYACPLILDPVCGCDGETYDNACFAWLNGVNVAFSGECGDGPGPACSDDRACPEGFTCQTPFGECDAEGTCVELPEPGTIFCPLIYDPVCGCDGVTYGNPCLAFLVGASIASAGECPDNGVPACFGDAECGEGFFCAKSFGDCGGEGVCLAEIPPGKFACPAIFDPVCACDGMTYGNPCEATLANVNLAYAGPCCPGDLTLDKEVNVLDLLMLLGDWGACPGCPADLTGDGQVNVFDLLELLENWGACPDPPNGAIE